MGAWLTEQVAAGKTPAEAYRTAVADATAENGHQDGYSGAINSKAGGFTLVELPPRFTYRKFQEMLEDFEGLDAEIEDARCDVAAYRPGGIWSGMRGAKGSLRKAEARLKKARAARARFDAKIPPTLYNFDVIASQYHDKWEAPLAVELRGAERARYTRTTRRRGEKLYIFFGYAPS